MSPAHAYRVLIVTSRVYTITLEAASEHQAEAIARDLFETGQYREFDADNGREIIDLIVIREDAA
jgi:hypothetical protein